MTEQTKYPPLGTVSEGTMLARDLIPAFLSVLAEHAPERAAQIEASARYHALETYYDETDDTSALADDAEYHNPDEHTESAEDAEGYLLEDLFDALDELAAPYVRFGAHEGDGADYGYWPDVDALEDARRYGELATVADDGTLQARQDSQARHAEPLPELAMSVSDHGNVTLYTITYTLTEIWSIV